MRNDLIDILKWSPAVMAGWAVIILCATEGVMR